MESSIHHLVGESDRIERWVRPIASFVRTCTYEQGAYGRCALTKSHNLTVQSSSII